MSRFVIEYPRNNVIGALKDLSHEKAHKTQKDSPNRFCVFVPFLWPFFSRSRGPVSAATAIRFTQDRRVVDAQKRDRLRDLALHTDFGALAWDTAPIR
jgi:hypothetical protein